MKNQGEKIMEEKYIVYTEIHNINKMERWYYGTYDHNKANDVAYELGRYENEDGDMVYHCVCKTSEARDFNILNLPKQYT